MSHPAINSSAHIADQISQTLGFVPLLPLLGSVVIYLLARSCSCKSDAHANASSHSEHKHSHAHSAHSHHDSHESKGNWAGWLATLFAAGSFALSLNLFLAGVLQENGAYAFKFWQWLEVGVLNVNLGLRMDRLAGVMTLIVTGVGTLIHLYAIGYMEHDESKPRFFAYLNLFLFAMLMLVLGDNLLVMFVGWEGVGLCSYLLIGFWYKEMQNAEAGQKAFVVNRIGDAGFLLGIFTLLISVHTLNFTELAATDFSTLSRPMIELCALLLFIGAVGKSAQFPLYIWLPDAMAGPTPVSALIHAATMVTAGVYMITKLSFIYVAAPYTLLLISLIGTLTAFLAASIALVQNDIKKVLAYSTVSQLGFMFMAIGAGAFSNAIFHVVTHAFFKACLFMGAGSVIIGCHHEQDMRKFGGLRKYMPLTFITYALATLAIAGFPYTSGFFSKDAILWTVFSADGELKLELFGRPLAHVLWGLGAFTAFLTAFYMTRSLVLTFFGEYRGEEKPHESPWVVTLPLLILGALSAFYGLFEGGALLHFLAQWTRPDMLGGHESFAHNETYHFLERLSMGIALAGIALAFVAYLKLGNLISALSRSFSALHQILLNKWYVDEIFNAIIVQPLRLIAQLMFKVIDRALIDGFLVSGSAMLLEVSRDVVRVVHNGRLSFYALLMLAFTVFFSVFWLVL